MRHRTARVVSGERILCPLGCEPSCIQIPYDSRSQTPKTEIFCAPCRSSCENEVFGRKSLLDQLSAEKLIAALAVATHRYYTELIKAGFSEAAALEIVKASDLIRGVSR